MAKTLISSDNFSRNKKKQQETAVGILNSNQDVVFSILEKLEPIDLLRFTAVCKEWLALSKKYHLTAQRWSTQLVPMLLILKEGKLRLYNVCAGKIDNNIQLSVLPVKRFCGSSRGWLAKDPTDPTVDACEYYQLYKDDVIIQLWNPFDKVTSPLCLPPLELGCGTTIRYMQCQVKRIHEYKRQLMNILGIVYRYKKMKEMSPEERKARFVPRVCIFGGKAFATYVQAKRIVKFITDVGAIVNRDQEIGDLLKVVFVPDYNVSVAEVLIPGSELSQHISTAGMEASGTSNMKFAMNGCIQIGTLDGANVEIREEVGEENFFLFGARAEEISGLRKQRSEGKFVADPRFEEVKAYVRSGVFGPYNYDELMGSLEGNEGYGRADYFLVGYDFSSYIECQDKVDEAYRDQKRWTKMSILNTAGSYKFSSDRTIHEYARDIWRIEPVVLP